MMATTIEVLKCQIQLSTVARQFERRIAADSHLDPELETA